MGVLKNPILFFLVLIMLSSCATAPFSHVDGVLRDGDYAESAALLEKHKKKLYKNRDAILYYLDKGLVTHYAGQYQDSSKLLENGERAIEAAFTKSVTAEIGSYLVNDTVKEYDGEDYEDIYLNVFNALNYYHRGNIEDAMVEIRRMNNKIRFLSAKYGVIKTNLQEKALEESAEIPPNADAELHFSDSALARYLGLLFYRDAGRYDDARIDQEGLKIAFANTPDVYTHPLPSSIDNELEIPEGKARLNVLAFGGLSPVKQEETLRIPISSSNYVKIALPVLVERSSQIKTVELVIENGPAFELELLEDIEAVARETFKEKQDVIYLKTVIRATMKGVTSSVLDAAASSDEIDGTTSLILSLLGFGNKIFAEASEQADLRISRYFPGKAYIGGINLDPGTYSFTVNYRDSSGRSLASFRQENIMIYKDRLNLLEAVCLK
ncbi:hypothetical protein FACS1894110_12960 [Spirochaetia bacterium]|nr:hypothetical protein FACS1894110_12960 [Spirochaetia bacterium]